MDIKDKLSDALKTAMKEQNDVRKKALRMAISSIKLAEVEKGETLEETRVLSILQKEIKTREETIDEAKKADRPEMINELEKEINVIKEFLPQELTDEELENLINQVIDELHADNIKQMGLVMKKCIELAAGRASNDRLSKFIKSKLA